MLMLDEYDPSLITLKNLVFRSRIIVVATRQVPAFHSHKVFFFDSSVKDILPYNQSRFHFTIDDVLLGYASIDDGSIDDYIEVIEADSNMRQTEHYNYHVNNMTMSNHCQRYAQKFEETEGEPRILFLQEYNDELSYIVNGGDEGLQAVDEVREIIRKKNYTDLFGLSER